MYGNLLMKIIMIIPSVLSVTFTLYKNPNTLEMDSSNKTEMTFLKNTYLKFSENVSRYVCNDCGIHSIYRETLSESFQLTHLTIKDNKIKYIDPNAFENNLYLEELNFNGNQLSTFEVSFAKNMQLRYLDLSFNNLQFLYVYLFSHLEKFETLILDGNRHLANRKDATFLCNKSLRKISCAYCYFRKLDSMTFSCLPNLLELNLKNNKIDTVGFNSLGNVERLYLQGNYIVHFEPIIFMTNLKTLCLAGNLNFDYYTFKFQNMRQLEKGCCQVIFPDEENEPFLLPPFILPKLEKLEKVRLTSKSCTLHNLMISPIMIVVLIIVLY